MSGLGHWLKELVVVVLLAGLTELLLPSQAMQRYVRTVMGLAIIAMMLQPIVPLFDTAWAQKAAVAASEELEAGPNSTAGPSPQVIASSLADVQAQQADALLAQTLAREIQSRYGVTVNGVRVSGAGAPDIRVVIELATGTTKASQIQSDVAGELGISRDQVEVDAS